MKVTQQAFKHHAVVKHQKEVAKSIFNGIEPLLADSSITDGHLSITNSSLCLETEHQMNVCFHSTIDLRRPWTRAFFSASFMDVGFSLELA